MATPTAVFPGAIATDGQLKVANNLITTTLKVSAAATDTILFVNSVTGFVANSLVSIDSEIVAIASVVSGGNPQLVVATGGRGFDGTSAATHSGGAKVSMYIDAWHHNAMAAEVKAIESALGPSLGNIGKSPFIFSTDYMFAAQTPGGSLIAGSNTITLSPVPKGVNGSDANHYLYISGGTGTAEAVLITGGTAVAGAASGTVIVTCANTHSGAWTIQTATAGIQEAVQYVHSLPGTSASIYIPAGNWSTYATITVNTTVILRGTGCQGGSAISLQTLNIDCIHMTSQNGCAILDLALFGPGGTGTGWAFVGNGNIRCYFTRLLTLGFNYGFWVTGDNYTSYRDVDVINFNNVGVQCAGNNNVVVFDNVNCSTGATTGNGLYVTNSGQILFVNCSFLGANYGFLCQPASGQVAASLDFAACYFDHNGAAAAALDSTTGGGSITRTRFSECWIGSATGVGMQFTSTGGKIYDTALVECHISGNGNNGVTITGPNTSSVKIVGCSIFNNGMSVAGSGIALDNGIDNVVISNNFIGNDASWSATATQVNGISVGTDTHLVITDNAFKANTSAAIVVPASLTTVVIRDNSGVDDVIPVLASAAGLSTPNTHFEVTGTTTVTTITPTWTGRDITIMKTDAGSVTIGGGGNILLAHTLAQYGSLRLTFDGSYWY
jgi:hypothetical protein